MEHVFIFKSEGDHRRLHRRRHSFPTRRSSDLIHVNELDLLDIDTFLNTYPHRLWLNADLMKSKPELLKACYEFILDKITKEIQTLSKDLYLSLFQGFLSIDKKICDLSNPMDAFIIRFFEMINKNKLSKMEILKFLELLSEFILSNEQTNPILDIESLAKHIHKYYLTKVNINKFTIFDITSLLWSFYRMNTLPKDYFTEIFEKVIEMIKKVDLNTRDSVKLTQLMENCKLLMKVEKKLPSKNVYVVKTTLDNILMQTAVEDLFEQKTEANSI